MSHLALAFERPFSTLSPLSFGHFGSLLREMDRRVMGDWSVAESTDLLRNMKLDSTGEGYELRIDLPGLTEKDVALTVYEGFINLSGEVKQSLEEGTDVLVRERLGGTGNLKFNRSVRVPKDVDDSRVVASMKNGVLTITLPKQQSALPREIPLIAQ